MAHYPIIFGLRDLIQGDGFLAGVAVEGRALLHEDENYVWVEGVNPGGFAGTGSNPGEAMEDFRRGYRAILFDIASEERSFDEFNEAVHRFFDNAGEQPVREWEEAVQEVRSGKIDAPWMARRSADTKRSVHVIKIEEPASKNNVLEEGSALAA